MAKTKRTSGKKISSASKPSAKARQKPKAKSAAKKPAAKQVAAKKGAAANKSAANKSAANKSAANKSAANKSAANKSAAKKPAAKQVATKKGAATNKSAANKPAAKKVPATKAAPKPSPVKTSPAKVRSATTSPITTSPITTLPATASPATTGPTTMTTPPATTAEVADFSFSDADLDSLVFEVATDKPDATAFAPGTLVEHKGGTYSVVYSKFPESADLAAVYDERGLQGGGYTWHGFVVHLLKQHAPEALPALQFDPEGSMFCAVSTDLSALRAVGAALAQLENIELVKQLAMTVDVSEYD